MIDRYSAVVKKNVRGEIMTIYAVFPTSKAAYECAENANAWYGEDHPLTPLTVVNDVLWSPRPFPVMK